MRCWSCRGEVGSRVPRDLVDVINVLAVPEPRSAYFLLLVQEKVRKEKDTPVAAPPQLLLFPSPACGGGLGGARFPALLTAPGRSPNSPAAKNTPLGLEHGRAKTTGSGCGARLALRGLNSNGNCNCNRTPRMLNLSLGGSCCCSS